jgi:hypothetical protein
MGAVVVEEVSGLQGVGNYFLDMAVKLDEQYEVEELLGAKGLISRHQHDRWRQDHLIDLLSAVVDLVFVVENFVVARVWEMFGSLLVND